MARNRDVRAALVQATTELVGEVGYQRATTRAIAARAGVAEGSIYRYFPDKHALFTAAVLEGQQGVVEWMSALPGLAGSRTVGEVLTDAFVRLSELRASLVPLEIAMAAMPDAVVRDAAVPPAAVPPALVPPAAVPPAPRSPGDLDAAIAVRGGPPHLLAVYLRSEQDLGRLRPDVDPARVAVLLLAALFGAQTSPLAGADGLGRPAIAELVGILVEGLAPRSATPGRA